MRIHGLLPALLATAIACGGDSVLPTPEGESAEVITTFPSTAVDTMVVSEIHVIYDTFVNGADTAYCLFANADALPGEPPGEGEDPTVDLVEMWACGPTLAGGPTHWTTTFDPSLTPATARASTIGYYADSGSAVLEPLGGGFAELKWSGRYLADGSDLPPRFRITATIIGKWLPDTTE